MRRLTLAVAAALLLPVVALAAMVGQQEYALTAARIVNVPLRGYDPRDLLRGHYISAQLDWEWASAPATREGFQSTEGGLCVLPSDSPKPRVRFLPGWSGGNRSDGDCRVVIAGRAIGSGASTRFVPDNLDYGGGGLRLFIAEGRGAEFDEAIRQRPGALTVDLAVRADGSAAIKALRLDGKVIGR